jgi:hypothetical protein
MQYYCKIFLQIIFITFANMGRKPLHKPESMEIGQRMELTGKMKKYSWQYLNNFNKRGTKATPPAKYQHIKEGDKIFIVRTA